MVSIINSEEWTHVLRTHGTVYTGGAHLLGNLNFYRPFGPMKIQAAEKNPLVAEDDLLPAAVACRHLAFERAGQWGFRTG